MEEEGDAPSQQREMEPPVEGVGEEVDHDEEGIDADKDVQMVVEMKPGARPSTCLLLTLFGFPRRRIHSGQFPFQKFLSYGIHLLG